MIICGSLWAENVFVADDWVFSKKDGEEIKTGVTIKLRGLEYKTFIVEMKGKYKFQVMLERKKETFVQNQVWGYSTEPFYEYGLPNSWPLEYVIVKYYTEQKTSLLEYTEDVQNRLRQFV